MNRRHFLKTSSIAGISLSILPQLLFEKSNQGITFDELIGMGTPELFGTDFKLRKTAYLAFLELSAEALKSNIRVQVVSSYRSFNHQNKIWERKYKRYQNSGMSPKASLKKIIEYSTIPGTSRHHWGTDLDIIDANVTQPKHVLNPIHFETGSCFSDFKKWMDKHANNFGFFLVYTDTKTRKGFKYEPWHYSYKPLSKPYLNDFKKLNIKQILTSTKLMGHEYFSESFITNYWNEHVLDINPELL